MKLPHCISRRRFIERTALAMAASAVLPPKVSAASREFRRGGMIYRPLGRTGINLSLLGFGSHTDRAYKQSGGIRNVLTSEGQERRDRHISHALDLGVNLVDVYEHEGQWEPLAKLLKPRRQQVVVAGAYDNPEFIGDNIDRLAKLYGGYIDLYRIRSETVAFDYQLLEQWDVLRRAREAGKIRAIGIACHLEGPMMTALRELEGLDFLFLPYNFIHAKADYSQILPAAEAAGIGLVGMKALAAGSIAGLDPRLSAGPQPENSRFMLFNSATKAILPAAVAALTKTLQQLPDETLCQAALRYVYSRPFLSTTMVGMFDDTLVDANHAALTRYDAMSREETAALDAARHVARLTDSRWLAKDYQWLDTEWRV